ncbi:hypothetical protein B0H14DRAFT_2416771, partial [Mycena olivaceomarginata]
HDRAAVSKIKERAIREMVRKSVVVGAGENKEALQLYPRARSSKIHFFTGLLMYLQICGLARKVHDSSPIGAAFEKIVSDDTTIVGQTTALACRCASRWNSEYDCLDTTLILRDPVKKLVAEKNLNLKAFKLSERQWAMAEDLRDCVMARTLMFSLRGSTQPLICDVLPMLEDLRRELIRASEMTDLANICWVAAYGGSLVATKYLNLIPACEAYEFAIGI